MHIHKINSTSQEHQNFLAQNRKDPIIGDSISEGDEVVFCASCKSVFLKDTWEYLGKQHCRQNNTLVQFPIAKKLELSIQEDIFFYCFLESRIPTLNNANSLIKKRELSEYHQFFNLHIYYIATSIFIVSVVLSFVANSWAFVIGLISFFIAILFNTSHNRIQRKNVTTIYRNFTAPVFFLSTFGIGFSSYCGIKEQKLNFRYIESIEFDFLNTRLIGDCVIHHTDGKKTKFNTEHFFETWRTLQFLEAIDKFNKLFSIPIRLKVAENKHYQNAIDFVISNQSNITISVQ